MTVTPAALDRPQVRARSAPYVPPGEYRGRLDDFDYVEEEWFATGEADGRTYTTTVFVRRPRDQQRFSGTVVVEPLHAMGAPPIWLYTSDYIMRSGHGWAVISSQKTALDAHVKSSNPERYESLAIEADPPPPDAPEVDALNLPVGDPAKMAAFFAEMQRQNQRVEHDPRSGGRGASRRRRAPSRAATSRDVILTGHSQTGGVVTDYIRNAHDSQRLGDGSPVYHGYFPSGRRENRSAHATCRSCSWSARVTSRTRTVPGARAGSTGAATATNPGIATGCTSSPVSPTWGRDTRPTTTPTQWQQVATAGKVPTGRGHEQPPARRAVQHGAPLPGAVGRRGRRAAAGGTYRGRPRWVLRSGRARQQPRWAALRRDGRATGAVLRQPRRTRTGHPRSVWSAPRSRSTTRSSTGCTRTISTTSTASTAGSMS